MNDTDIDTHSGAGILVVDAGMAGARYAASILQSAGYRDVRLEEHSSGPLAERLVPEDVDLVVLDLSLREADGAAFLENLQRQKSSDRFLPVIAIGSTEESKWRVNALRSGATDCVAWPLDPEEFLARVTTLLDTGSLCRQLGEGRQAAEDLLRRSTRESQEGLVELLDRLARVAELRDDPSGGHPGRVGRLAGLIAQELELDIEDTRSILRAAPLHDLGNVGIPDDIVRVEGRFTDEEREQMRSHTTLGAFLLHGAENAVLQMAEQIALHHHERWDGFGYPEGLSHNAIPLPARIVAVADAFDAMTHPGQYKEPYSIAAAIEEIQREAGWQFDPEVVAALARVNERQPGMLTVTPQALRRAPV